MVILLVCVCVCLIKVFGAVCSCSQWLLVYVAKAALELKISLLLPSECYDKDRLLPCHARPILNVGLLKVQQQLNVIWLRSISLCFLGEVSWSGTSPIVSKTVWKLKAMNFLVTLDRDNFG